MLQRFLANGGRIFRGTVRHIREVVEAGVQPFARPNLEDIRYSPDAIMVCAGLGARFIGGIEDRGVAPLRIPLVKLRAPWIDTGKSSYDVDGNSILSIIPLPKGDVSPILYREEMCIDDDMTLGHHFWIFVLREESKTGGLVRVLPPSFVVVLKPKSRLPSIRPENIKHLLHLAQKLCPEIMPNSHSNIEGLVVEVACDLWATRKGGGRLEVDWFPGLEPPRKVPVVFSYGYVRKFW